MQKSQHPQRADLSRFFRVFVQIVERTHKRKCLGAHPSGEECSVAKRSARKKGMEKGGSLKYGLGGELEGNDWR